jgi:ABC-2 type transport system permease protein
VAVVVFAAAAGTGLPTGGSALLGLAVAGVGLTFAAVTAVAVQVFENTRAVYGAVAAVIGWATGLLLLGAAYRSFADSFDDFVADYPEIAEYLGGAANVVNSGLALTMLMCALLTAAFGVASAMRARAEETSGRAELVLATATSRWAWLASYLSVALVGSALVLMAAGFGHGLAYGLTIADAGQISRLIGVAFVYLPAVWLVIALAVVGLGWLPRIGLPP